MNRFLQCVPIPTAGIALGLVALGRLLEPLSELFLAAGVFLASILVALLTARIVSDPRNTAKDFRNPVLASVFGAFFMAIFQIAAACQPIAPLSSFAVWSIAIAGHLALIIFVTVRFVLRFSWENLYPTFFIAYVGIIVASTTAPTFGMQELGRGFFAFGFACYIILLPAVTRRLVTRPLDDSFKPLFCIYAAPMSLSLAGYLTCFDSPDPLAATIIGILAQGFLAIVIMRTPFLISLTRRSFLPSCAAMTFPFVISATALGKLLAFLSSSGFAIPDALNALCGLETAFAVAMLGYAGMRYAAFFKRSWKESRTAEASGIEAATPSQSGE